MQTNINKKPNTTVLMPVYNGEKYLREAIESILNQSFADFEFLIINDGSTDSSEEIIRSYNDSRIKLINNGINLGLIKSLNKGLDLTKGEYIARMDQDDISLPKRLEIQVNFMDKHPEIGVFGTWAKIIGETRKKNLRTYSDREKIKTLLLFGNALVHSSVLMRKTMLNTYVLKYNKNYQYAEDYELWTRAIKHFPIANIKKILLLYRKHSENMCQTHSISQKRCSEKIQINQLKNNLAIEPDNEEILIHNNIYKLKEYSTLDFLDKTDKWLNKLIKQNKKTNYYKEPYFSKFLAERWLKTCSVNANYDFKIFKIFWKSNLRKNTQIKDYIFLTKFFIKSIFKKSANSNEQ